MIGGLFKQTATSDLRHPTAWLSDWFTGGRKSASGADVTPASVLTLPVYWAAIRNIAEDIAKMPLHLYRQAGRMREKAIDEPLYELLHAAPNAEMTSMGFRETMMQWALGWRAGFAEVERGPGGDVISLWPIHPSRVRPVRDEATGALFWRVRGTWTDEGGTRREADVDIPDADMLVIHGVGNDGLTGYSTMQIASEPIGLGLALQSYGSQFFGGSAAVMAVLTMDKKPNADEMLKLGAEWDERYGGPNPSKRPLFLPTGSKYERIDVDPEKAQAIESRKFQVEDLARVFRMPLSKINAGSAAAGEHEAIAYVTDTLMPWCVRWEQEIRRKLIRPSEWASLYVKHADQALLRGDHAARGQFYQTMRNIGAFNINDIREKEELNPIEGGEIHFVPMNTIPLESATDFANAQIEKSMAAPQTTQRNPTDQGGGADNEPKQRTDLPAIAMGFVSPICQRLAVKEAKALEAATKKCADPKAFAAWAFPFYQSLGGEAAEALAEPMRSCERLIGGKGRLPDWSEHRNGAVSAFAAGTIPQRVEWLSTAWGPELAEKIVRAV